MQVLLYSWLYRVIRWVIKQGCYVWQWCRRQPRDLEAAVNVGHTLIAGLQRCHIPVYIGKHPIDQPVDVYDLTFKNPLTSAAYEANPHMLRYFLQLGIGGICMKTMMTQARPGNARPRLQEVCVDGHSTILNAMGLPGKGAEASLNALFQHNLCDFHCPIGLSIGGESPADYWQTFQCYHQRIAHHPHPFYYEINMSCPNTNDGQQLAESMALLEVG
jgi:dihydroorotate dehydrogenase